MKKRSRVISLLLIAAMSVTVAVSCGDKDEKKPNAGETTPETNANGEDEDNTDALVAELYGKQKYDGETVRILCPEAGVSWIRGISDTANEVWFEDAGSDVLQRAVYERNRKTENLLGLKIEPVWASGDNEIAERVGSDVAAGIDEYDTVLMTLGNSMTAAQNGNTLNLNDISTFNPSHEWWDERVVKELTLFGEDLYAIAGAINIMDDCSVSAYIFNKDLLEHYNCADPYQQVFDGTWTVDALMAAARACTQDLNGDTEFDENDSWGIGTYGNGLMFGLQGFDSGIARMNSEGIPTIICNTEENIEKCRYWFDNVTNSDCLYNEGVNGEESYQNLFYSGQLAFYMGNLTPGSDLRNMEDEYGILPEAKYNVDQANYTASCNTAWFTDYVIPKNCQNPEMVAACLEVMSGYSVNTVDESLHEIVFDSKFARDEQSRRILKIIQETVSFDWSGIGEWAAIDGMGINLCFAGMPQGASFTLASSLASVIDSAQESLDSLIEKFENR